MSRAFTAREIVEHALQMIGSYSINDTAADPEELRRGLERLDMMLAANAGVNRPLWLIPEPVTFALAANTASYVLETVMGSDYPDEGLLWPIDARLLDANDNPLPLRLVRADEFDRIDPAETGTPAWLYIDRLVTGTKVYVWPVPTVATFSVKLRFRTFSKTLVATPGIRGINNSQSGNTDHGLRATWQEWAVSRLAYILGQGVIRRIPNSDLDRFKQDYMQWETMLKAIENREHESLPHVTLAWDIDAPHPGLVDAGQYNHGRDYIP